MRISPCFSVNLKWMGNVRKLAEICFKKCSNPFPFEIEKCQKNLISSGFLPMDEINCFFRLRDCPSGDGKFHGSLVAFVFCNGPRKVGDKQAIKRAGSLSSKINVEQYCWCKRSCTSWYGKHPIIYSVFYTSQVVIARFLKHQQYQVRMLLCNGPSKEGRSSSYVSHVSVDMRVPLDSYTLDLPAPSNSGKQRFYKDSLRKMDWTWWWAVTRWGGERMLSCNDTVDSVDEQNHAPVEMVKSPNSSDIHNINHLIQVYNIFDLKPVSAQSKPTISLIASQPAGFSTETNHKKTCWSQIILPTLHVSWTIFIQKKFKKKNKKSPHGQR